MLRKIIFHYHLFKNAGTSVDRLLAENFPAKWVSKEFTGPHSSRRRDVNQWVLNEGDAVAFSSHTATPPHTGIENVEVFPICFVRHPIDRIASAYAFERRQNQYSFGSVLARNTSLAGYINIHLSMGHDGQCRNFLLSHLELLSDAVGKDREARAIDAVEALPFIGVVEHYPESIRRLAAWLVPHFPGFLSHVYAANASSDRAVSLEDRLALIKQEIGSDLYLKVTEANKADMRLFEMIRKRYA